MAVFTLAAGSTTTFAFDGERGDPLTSERWADHPALRPFAAAAGELPVELYLVRTRGELPDAAGVVVHGVHNRVFLVSGDPAAVTGLAYRGCAVIPLSGLPAGSRSASRQWVRVDTPDPAIEAMVAQVEWTGVSGKIQWAVDFGTRYSYAPNHSEVADSICAVFAGYGLTPVKLPFVYNSTTMYNVEATQTGTVYPDSFFILCGHFDSISEIPMTSAPGADDNGTGIATVLTAAEILTQHDFEYSIRYICFGGEEQGLRGSEDYAAWAAQNNLGIVGVLNFDMMGYWEPGVEMDLEIETNHASQWLAAAIVNAADLYTSAPYELHVYDGAWWGDHASFWDQGYAAVNHEESWDWGDPDFNPYYHTTNDVLTYVGEDFTVGNIKIGVAALATLARYVPGGTAVDDPATPPAFAGSLGAYPNPFSERVSFTVTGLRDRAEVRVHIYDARGRRVGGVPVFLQDGQGTALWNVTDDSAREIGSGVYFAQLEGFTDVAPLKIVHLK
jgi:aminopeptidase YwaD